MFSPRIIKNKDNLVCLCNHLTLSWKSLRFFFLGFTEWFAYSIYRVTCSGALAILGRGAWHWLYRPVYFHRTIWLETTSGGKAPPEKSNVKLGEVSCCDFTLYKCESAYTEPHCWIPSTLQEHGLGPRRVRSLETTTDSGELTPILF